MVIRTVLIAVFASAAFVPRAWSTCSGHARPSTETTSGGFEYTYPWPINYHALKTQNQTLCQAYMDVDPSPATRNGKTIVMLHGKNFCGVTWVATARVMLAQGYRVVLPDQIGFCKSDKPERYAFSLHQLCLNTKTILDSLNITAPSTSASSSQSIADSPPQVTMMGHSLGGMLAARFSLMYPSSVERLIMVDPIGLEDGKAKGVPYQPVENIYKQEASSNYTSIRGYEQATYYVGEWRPAYDRWVNMLLRLYDGPLGDLYAWVQALITDMVYTQPIVYELPLLGNTKTLLVVGEKDTTAIGAAWSPPEVQAVLGHYDVLGREAVAAIGPNATLVAYPELGHSPHISDPDRFHADVLNWLQ